MGGQGIDSDRCFAKASLEVAEPVAGQTRVVMGDQLDLGHQATHRVMVIAQHAGPRLDRAVGQGAKGR